MKKNKDLILAKYILTITANESGKRFLNMQFPPLLDTPQLRNELRRDLYELWHYIGDRMLELGEKEEVHERHREEFKNVL